MTEDDLPGLNVGIVEDELRLRDLLVREVTAMGHRAEGFPSAEQAWPRVAEAFDAVILDLNLPGMAGMELFRRIRGEERDVAVVILTGFGAFDSAVQSVRWRAEDYLTKPCSLADIDRALSRVLARKREGMRRSAVEQLGQTGCDTPDVDPEDGLNQAGGATSATLADMQRQHILSAMQKHGGDKRAVAAELGISLRTVYNRVNEYRYRGLLP
ncbi:MAG: response regulator [Planctomycetes bacterium]|nr:response regulator [Planctomycetota bacterium]